MRLDLFSFLTVSVYHQAIARPEIALENPVFIHGSSTVELRRRAEISNQASSGDFVVALDSPAAAVSNGRSDFSSHSQPTDPSGRYETNLSAAGSTDEISLTGSDNSCSASSDHNIRKRESCAGKSKDDLAHGGVYLTPVEPPTEPERGCPPSGRRLRKRGYCGPSSGNDETQDDSSSNYEKRFCPRNRRTVCCKGPKPSGIYTHGCSDCKYLFLAFGPVPLPGASFRRPLHDLFHHSKIKYRTWGGGQKREVKHNPESSRTKKKPCIYLVTTIFDPRCIVWNINCCVYYISNAKPGSDIHTLLNDEGVGVFCYTPLFFPIH